MTHPDLSPRPSTADQTGARPEPTPSTRFALIAVTAIVLALTVLGSVVWFTVQHNRRPGAAYPKAAITSHTGDQLHREPVAIVARRAELVGYARRSERLRS